MWPHRYLLIIAFVLSAFFAHSQQQDVEFHLAAQFLQGKTVLKVKRDFYDPYVWVLVKNNEIYRINSLTSAVDDFTSQFSSYNDFQFIDIAGRSKDTVFIATNTTNVIHYKNGSSRLIGATDGIPGTVNSIGIAEQIIYQLHRQPVTLMIATDKGFRQYDTDGEKIIDQTDYGDSKIYQATYRTEMYKDSTGRLSGNTNTVAYQPVVFIPRDTGPTDIAFLWENDDEYGYNINTAETIYESIDIYNPVFTNLFWGNSRGMFQNDANNSFSPIFSPVGHYLDGINVNKITNIYGLTPFGSGDPYDVNFLIRQNLLIGTDNGFYFSSSIYTSVPDPLRPFALFHYDELGNIRVNDVYVNTSSTVAPVCEDGVWLACDNGLYLLRPDYGKFLNNQQVNAARFQDVEETVSSLKICSGTSASIFLTSSYSGHIIQWYKDGQEMTGKNAPTLSVAVTGDYYAVLYDPCEGIHIESNHLKVQVIESPVFSFNYPDKIQHCDNTPVVLTTDDNPNYHYRWYADGVLSENTTSSFTVTQSGKYKVEVSACTDNWIPSKEVEVDLIQLPVPQISSVKTQYCAGETASLTLNVPVDATYTINWYRDGNLLNEDQNKTSIAAANDGAYSVIIKSNIATCDQVSDPLQIAFTPLPVYTFNYPDKLVYCTGTPVSLKAEGSAAYQYRWYKDDVLTGNTNAALQITQSGKYRIEVSVCPNSWVPSKEVTVTMIDISVPIIQSNKTAYCIGDPAILSISTPASSLYTINWYRDNNILSNNQNQTSLTTDIAGSYTAILTSNTVNTDGTVCTQSSISKAIVFNPIPTVSIQKIVRTTLCDGQSVDLKVSYNNGSVSWSTGQNSDQITVNKSSTYKALVTSAAGCISDASIDVQFFPNPVLNIPNTTVCVPSHKTVTLTAPPGMASYSWNGQSGTNTYVAEHPQTVTLIVTDDNGCTATQEIQVADECADVKIPNTFTPNGDGVNDTWNIQGFEFDNTATIKIFTRYGRQIYYSKGYSKPWDGNYESRQLPIGVYYYVIMAKSGKLTFSGSITILR